MSVDEQIKIEARRAAWWVRHHAEQRQMTLEALAVASGVGRTSIMNMRNRAPSLRTLVTLALYFDVQVRDLLRDIPESDGG